MRVDPCMPACVSRPTGRKGLGTTFALGVPVSVEPTASPGIAWGVEAGFIGGSLREAMLYIFP